MKMEAGPSKKESEMNKALEILLLIFPNISPHVVERTLMQYAGTGSSIDDAQAHAAEELLGLDVSQVGNRNSAGETSGSMPALPTPPAVEDPFKLTPVPDDCQVAYKEWCLHRLQLDFPKVSLTDLRRALKMHMGRIGPSHRAVKAAFQEQTRKLLAASGGLLKVDGAGSHVAADKGKGKYVSSGSNVQWLPEEGIRLLVKGRPPLRVEPSPRCPLFEQDWEAVQRAYNKEALEKDMQLAQDVNGEEYVANGQEIECGCCFGDFPFETMAQCADGHLFCFGCLKRRVEESTFGAMGASGALQCMNTDGCEETFPLSEVKRALPEHILAKYEERQAEDALMKAQLEGLVRCPFCELPVEMDPEQRVLLCPGCNKKSCRSCKEPDHVPLRCDEVKKETDVRKRVEEEMTKAFIRTCPSCKAELFKSEGCNKVTCRCGKAMCYVCKEAIKDYKHFCQCPHRQKNEACQTCKKCSLWAEEDEEEEVKKARDNILKEIAEQDPELLKRPMGPPDEEPAPKRPRGMMLPPLPRGFPPPLPIFNDARLNDPRMHDPRLHYPLRRHAHRAGLLGGHPQPPQNPPPNLALDQDRNALLDIPPPNLALNLGPNHAVPRNPPPIFDLNVAPNHGAQYLEVPQYLHAVGGQYGQWHQNNIWQMDPVLLPPAPPPPPAPMQLNPQGLQEGGPARLVNRWVLNFDGVGLFDPHALAAMPDPPHLEEFRGHNLRG
eukprot:TRINITY_DN16388_c0_g1_i1.p1 TRINITY_DN16388_c0_g1~~TRINITY_DN16388_c0_g1_i1.p1  ORF type:complete len:720 (-),score=138.25 TRINITY_DN16388_c0_g1_i1:787-2946(-)